MTPARRRAAGQTVDNGRVFTKMSAGFNKKLEKRRTMKKQYMLGILFCGGLWGVSEAALGGWMYSAGMRQVSPVMLTVIAFAILAVARVYVPLPGSSTAIGALAMLFKFLNEPFFACHLLAIFLLGASFDLVYSLARGRRKPLIGLASTYLGFALFALLITYAIQYSYWIKEGWPKVLHYVGYIGTIAAVCNAVVVPLGDLLGRKMSQRAAGGIAQRAWAFRSVAAATTALWVFALIRQF